MARSALNLLCLSLFACSAVLATTSTATCSFEGATIANPSSCSVVAGSDGGAYATATTLVQAGVSADVTVLAEATLRNFADDGATQYTDSASAYADATTLFCSSGPFRQGLISLDYSVYTTAYDAGAGTVTLVISDGVHTYNFSGCGPGAGTECSAFKLLTFDLGTTFTVTAVASVSPIYLEGEGGAYASVQFELAEAANDQAVETLVVPEPGTVWLLAVVALFVKLARWRFLLEPAKAR